MPSLNSYVTPFARPLYVMLKPIGAVCNLRCKYCYYLEKKDLYPNAASYLMSDALLERFIKQYLESQTTPEVLFTWHGGETLMRNIDFYKKALELQKIYGRGRQI
ncbi:MAG: anaerobic sulfatase maturase, partial [Tannerella sp.]|nr:anaerobic sulfatase maturase [Tannerella sp.]